MNFEACKHDKGVDVLWVHHNLSATPDGPVEHRVLEVKSRCAVCGVPMRFKGLPVGISLSRPVSNLGGDIIHLPVELSPDAPAWTEAEDAAFRAIKATFTE